MSLAVTEISPVSSSQRRRTKGKPSKDQRHVQTLISEIRDIYANSQFAKNIDKQLAFLNKSSSAPITRIVSLGLGSLSSAEKGQTRRLKQLATLVAIRDSLQKHSKSPLEVYAQDPTFTRQDELLLSSFDIWIARTSSGSSLGEAAELIDSSTLIYSPFLTLEAYEQLLVRSKQPVQFLIGDDFNALLEKWPKYSAERAQVEKVTKLALGNYRRKAISGSGFWDESDGAFPMAVYAVQSSVKEKARI